ncbi:hypothetical protein EI94DRAFT_1462796, partial [Lactarius quietus]
PPPPEYFLNCSILAARNVDVAKTNKLILDHKAGPTRTNVSVDTVIHKLGADSEWEDNSPPIPVEFLWSINSSSLPPGELCLKV